MQLTTADAAEKDVPASKEESLYGCVKLCMLACLLAGLNLLLFALVSGTPPSEIGFRASFHDTKRPRNEAMDINHVGIIQNGLFAQP